MGTIWFFEKVDLFNILCPHKFSNYKESHELNIYKKGYYVYFPNERAKSIYLIAGGKIKILNYNENGDEVVKAILSKGEMFGEMALFGEDNRDDYAVSIDEETVLCHMTIENMKAIMAKDQEFSLKIHKLIGFRIKKLERRLDALIFKDVKTRILDFIREYASEKGIKKGNEVFVKNYLTHKDIADLVGTSRQTVTTILNELKSLELISFTRKSFVVHDMNNLVA
jgi:CRP-like cAMP-binding protein